MLKIVIGLIGVALIWVFCLPTTTNNLLIKIGIAVIFITFIAPILVFHLKTQMKSKSSVKSVKKQIDLQHYQAIKKIYKEEREQYYQEARTLFHDLAKQGMLDRQDLLTLKMLIEDCLGNYIHEFDGFKHEVIVKTKQGEKKVIKKGFENIYHQLYCYLKSYYLNKEDWTKIINYLKSFELTKEEVR